MKTLFYEDMELLHDLHNVWSHANHNLRKQVIVKYTLATLCYTIAMIGCISVL